jgi:hypothetical protein
MHLDAETLEATFDRVAEAGAMLCEAGGAAASAWPVFRPPVAFSHFVWTRT